jgi:hypothetical protein
MVRDDVFRWAIPCSQVNAPLSHCLQRLLLGASGSGITITCFFRPRRVVVMVLAMT